MPSLKFNMDPRKDLSTRADFTFDLMKQVSDQLQEAVDAVPEVQALRGKADVKVETKQSLTGVTIDVKITPKTEEDIADDLAKLRQAVHTAVSDKMKETIGQSLQSAFQSARARM